MRKHAIGYYANGGPGYWRSTQSRKPHTRAGYETAWRLRIEPRFGRMPVRRIKPSHIDDWVADMIEQGLSVSKITESLGVLRRVLDRVARIGPSRLIHARYEPLACPSASKPSALSSPLPRSKRSPRQFLTNPILY